LKVAVPRRPVLALGRRRAGDRRERGEAANGPASGRLGTPRIAPPAPPAFPSPKRRGTKRSSAWPIRLRPRRALRPTCKRQPRGRPRRRRDDAAAAPRVRRSPARKHRLGASSAVMAPAPGRFRAASRNESLKSAQAAVLETAQVLSSSCSRTTKRERAPRRRNPARSSSARDKQSSSSQRFEHVQPGGGAAQGRGGPPAASSSTRCGGPLTSPGGEAGYFFAEIGLANTLEILRPGRGPRTYLLQHTTEGPPVTGRRLPSPTAIVFLPGASRHGVIDCKASKFLVEIARRPGRSAPRAEAAGAPETLPAR